MNKTAFPGVVIRKKLGSVFILLGALLSLTSISHADESVKSSTASQLPAIKTSLIPSSLLQDIARVGDRLVVVGERGHIAYSDDNGVSWQQADVPTREMLNAVYFADQEIGWAVGYDGLVLHTRDGGKSWVIQLDGLKFTRQRMVEKIPVLKTRIEKMQQDKAAAEEQLADAEANGEEDLAHYEDVIADLDDKLGTLESDLEDAQVSGSETVANPLMDVWFRDVNTGFAVGAFGEFLKTEDGGINWTGIEAALDNDDRHHLNAITGRGNLMYIAGEAGHIYRSTDGGVQWSLLKSPDPENGSFFAINIISDDEVLVSGLRGAIYRSSDRGNSWKQIPEDLHKNINSVFFAGGDTVLAVGNDGAFLRSRDGGRTFLSHVRKNRLTVASVAEAANGSYVLVGMGGVQLVQPDSL